MPTYPRRGTTITQTNVGHIGAAAGRVSQVSPIRPQNPIAANPMFGRPIWSYVHTMAGPVRGPQPRLAQGTGKTGASGLPGNTNMLPGYLSDNEYFPSTFSYDPVDKKRFLLDIPRTIMTGTDGRDFVIGGYKPHDFTPTQRFFGQMRQAANWQVMEYPPDFRNLLAWQQVQRYRIQSFTVSPRPLDQSNYFLGYQVNPQVSQAIGQTTMGYMGSQ